MRILMIFLVVIFTLHLSATIINIPADQPTIQDGINVSTWGDTVLVQPNTYVENINYIGKNITVASLFLTTQDSSYIEQTIIDGNQNGSVVTFMNEEDSLAVLCGFTITNGFPGTTGYCYGGGINCQFSNPILKDLLIINNSAGSGGGLYIHDSNSKLINVKIINNHSFHCGGGIHFVYSNQHLEDIIISNNSAERYGGGIYVSFSPELVLENVSINNNTAQLGGGIYNYTEGFVFSSENKCNIYQNTISEERGFGSDIYYRPSSFGPPNNFNVIVDTFTVLNPTDYYATPIQYITFDIIHSKLDSLVNADVYVSPDGNNMNSGLSSEEPFKTIKFALSKIYADSLANNSIILSPGVYSVSTNGEQFPLYWSDNVRLKGSLEGESILDGENQTEILKIFHASNVLIEDLNIINGAGEHSGGGIGIIKSTVEIDNITISSCNDIYVGYGGGIDCDESNLKIVNSTFQQNDSNYGGGLICRENSIFDIRNSEFIDNSADRGGGIAIWESNGTIFNCQFTSNDSYNNGGGIEVKNSDVNIKNCIIRNNVVTCNFPAYDNNGGGINCIDESVLIACNVLIENNYADFGGGIYCYESSLDLINCTITENTGNQFAGINSQYSDVNIINSIVWGNNVQDILVFLSDSNIIYSDIGDGEYLPGIGNINTDPLFSGLGLHPYSLSDISPCVNAGIPDTTGLNLPEFDLAENPRVFGGRIDMGAYENQNVIVSIDEELMPLITKLKQNYPNPFNPTTTISFSVTQNSDFVTLEIYNIKGQKVKTLVDRSFEKGNHSVTWNGTNENNQPVSSGIYFYKLKVNGTDVATSKCALLK